MDHNRLFILTILILAMSKVAFAEEIPLKNGLATVIHSVDDCASQMDFSKTLNIFSPPQNEVASKEATGLKHKSGGFITFSKDGTYFAIHHDKFPDAELVSLRSVDQGNLLSSFAWRGPNRNLFNINSLAIDQTSHQILASAANVWGVDSDAVLVWDSLKSQATQNFLIPGPSLDSFTFSHEYFGQGIQFLSPISAEHPYLIRFRREFDKKSGNLKYIMQIINWKNRSAFTFDEVSPSYNSTAFGEISSTYRYFAIPLHDYKTVQLLSFADVEKKLKSFEPLVKDGPLKPGATAASTLVRQWFQRLFQSSGESSINSEPTIRKVLVHQNPVLKVSFVNWAPLVVTQTKDGLFIWDVNTQELVDHISGPIENFRVLEKMSIIAYVTSDRRLCFYSPNKAVDVAFFTSFNSYSLNTDVENWKDGTTYVTDLKNTVYEITQTDNPLNFFVVNTRLRLVKKNSRQFKTVIETQKDKYLLTVLDESSVGDDKRTLVVEIFSFNAKERVATRIFPMAPYTANFIFDPNRKYVFYTADHHSTGLINIEAMLKEMGL